MSKEGVMRRCGLTLLELVVVMIILVALASLAVPLIGNLVGDSRGDVTRQSLIEVRNVIANMYWDDMGKRLPRADPVARQPPTRKIENPQVRYLFINPTTENSVRDYDPAYRRGWRGPYLMNPGFEFPLPNTNFTDHYGQEGDPAVIDGWGSPIVLQNPGVLPDGRQDVRVVSAGPDGILNIPRNKATALLDATDKGDDVWLAFEVR
jgi:prepilin-type N-terminal cleavage/methylation domain-containing protein